MFLVGGGPPEAGPVSGTLMVFDDGIEHTDDCTCETEAEEYVESYLMALEQSHVIGHDRKSPWRRYLP